MGNNAFESGFGAGYKQMKMENEKDKGRLRFKEDLDKKVARLSIFNPYEQRVKNLG